VQDPGGGGRPGPQDLRPDQEPGPGRSDRTGGDTAPDAPEAGGARRGRCPTANAAGRRSAGDLGRRDPMTAPRNRRLGRTASVACVLAVAVAPSIAPAWEPATTHAG